MEKLNFLMYAGMNDKEIMFAFNEMVDEINLIKEALNNIQIALRSIVWDTKDIQF